MELIIKYWPLFLEGATTTVLLSFFSVIVGVGCGTLMALARLSQNKFLSKAAKVYIDIIRGTPLLVQLYLVYFGLATVLDLNDFVSGVIAVSVNTTAYIAEIIRSGIQSVDKGQVEAARSMGMPKRMAMRQIILPQAMKNILPAIGNEFATLIKRNSRSNVQLRYGSWGNLYGIYSTVNDGVLILRHDNDDCILYGQTRKEVTSQ